MKYITVVLEFESVGFENTDLINRFMLIWTDKVEKLFKTPDSCYIRKISNDLEIIPYHMRKGDE